MPVVRRSVSINAPVGKVFGVVTNPENWTRYVTSLAAVTNLSPDSPARGSTFRWDYRMLGFKMTGGGEVTENVKNKRFGLALQGRASVNEAYEFEKEDGGGTKLKVTIEYELPGKVLEFIASSRLAEKLNSMESKAVLSKIKAMCEGV